MFAVTSYCLHSLQSSSDFSYTVAVARTMEEIRADWQWLCDILVPTLGNGKPVFP